MRRGANPRRDLEKRGGSESRRAPHRVQTKYRGLAQNRQHSINNQGSQQGGVKLAHYEAESSNRQW